ncbi:MAG: pyridoxamine 5'-phosphate oxidase family protein [Pseudomonadota bacterium]|nr:pyridoxamine 5'-phosphate oxidase family protein [Pseudomonadota bacterium]
MKIHQLDDARLKPMAEKLGSARVAMMVLDEPANGLCSRPMTALEMDRSGAVWFMASRKTTTPLLGHGPKAANLAFVDDGDSNYVSIAGEASMVDDMARKKELWSPAGRPWFSGVDDPDLTLIKVSPRHVEIWDGPDNAVSRVFAMAASMVAGKEVGMGDKKVVDVPK